MIACQYSGSHPGTPGPDPRQRVTAGPSAYLTGDLSSHHAQNVGRAHRTTISSTVPFVAKGCWYRAGGCRAGVLPVAGGTLVVVGVLRYTPSLWYHNGFQLPGL